MSVNLPPYPNVDRFNNLYWDTTPTTLTQEEADLKYLKYPLAQGTETLVATNVNGLLTTLSNINLQTTQPTNTNGYLGYTSKVNANVSGTLTTGVLFNMTSGAGLGIISPGVYLFNINIFNNKTTAGDITNVAIGISTSATAQVGGFTAYITGHQTYTTATTDNVVNTISYVFSVPTATNYYLNQVATFTSMTLNSTTISYCQFTRIA